HKSGLQTAVRVGMRLFLISGRSCMPRGSGACHVFLPLLRLTPVERTWGYNGTPLLGYLIEREVDTVIIMGGSTSNCVRATVFDASSYNFRTIVVQEGVFDRIPISHAISLFDMDRQFADVVPSAEV